MKRASKEEVEALREEIEDHLQRYPMSTSYFCSLAVRNSGLFARFESGGGCMKRTVKRVRKFIQIREATLSAQELSGIATKQPASELIQRR